MSMIFTPSSFVSTDTITFSDNIISTVSPLSVFSPIIVGPSTPLTISFEYSKPLIGVYETIDTNPEVRKKMLNYYYDLIRDKWLLDELNDVLNYFIYKDGKVNMIKNISEYSSNNIMKDTDKTAEDKILFLEKNLFTKYNLMEILNKFTKETNSKWVDLPKNEFFLKQVIKEYIIREIKKKLKENK